MIAAFFDYDPSISGYRYIVLTTDAPTLDTHTGGPDEEGWSATYTRWILDSDEGTVTCETTTDGADCDGRMSTRSDVVCDVADLASVVPGRTQEDEETGAPLLPFKVPAWRDVRRSQRDYSAEAAGY